MRVVLAGVLLTLVLAVQGCSKKGACKTSADCAKGIACVESTCVNDQLAGQGEGLKDKACGECKKMSLKDEAKLTACVNDVLGIRARIAEAISKKPILPTGHRDRLKTSLRSGEQCLRDIDTARKKEAAAKKAEAAAPPSGAGAAVGSTKAEPTVEPKAAAPTVPPSSVGANTGGPAAGGPASSKTN